MTKYLKYLWYVIRHKWYVGIECFKKGLYWQGLVHDSSKLFPSEFIPYARYFYGSKEGIKRGGASELNFVTPDGTEGSYQKHFLVYGQDNKTCPRCNKTKIVKIKLGGRGTYYCPNCQKLSLFKAASLFI